MLIVLKGRIISTEDSLFDLSVFRNKALDIRNRKYVGEEFSKKKHKSKKLDLRILGLKKEVQNKNVKENQFRVFILVWEKKAI